MTKEGPCMRAPSFRLSPRRDDVRIERRKVREAVRYGAKAIELARGKKAPTSVA